MAEISLIEWTDATWNIITGCSVKSAGCKHCYAMKLAGTRLQHHPSRAGLTNDTAAGPVWNGQVRFNGQWLDQPLRWRRPRRIFVCAHGDLFHESVPDEWIDKVFAVMALAPAHTFQVLTKRAERMRAYLSSPDVGARIGSAEREYAKAVDFYRPKNGIANVHVACERHMPLPNVWLGVSVENQDAADERIRLLLQTPAAVRWISAEPLLGPVDLVRTCWDCVSAEVALRFDRSTGGDVTELTPLFGIGWVVAGGESGECARPMRLAWVRALRDQCAASGVPFLFKQWGEWHPASSGHGGENGAFNGDIFMPGWGDISVAGRENNMVRAGKRAFGYRVLDGATHDQYPDTPPLIDQVKALARRLGVDADP
ncbi:MAG: phage Gp37/Gp68 family protein [Lysobacteraceae bacterium]|nr:MAG: phage Gp37/Gp68 family protein [Xanthomonadaceae bacterium]